jgi:patatin-like phospholipase/acyl hydrolase
MSESESKPPFNILCLDGGGAKGFYSLGFLRELESAVGSNLCGHFQAIYGTSTGAIIATLLASGRTVSEVLELYKQYVPAILGARGARKKSAKLKAAADKLYDGLEWGGFKPYVGVVATNWTHERPLVFKSSVDQAYGMKSTFVPGFGCKVSDAVRASCSATPYFKPVILELQNDGVVEARDGGFCANNPSLLAVSDALGPLRIEADRIRLLSLGVGHYPAPYAGWFKRRMLRYTMASMLEKTLSVSANTTEIQTKQLMGSISHVRVSERFSSPNLTMDFLESNVDRLGLLVQKGRDSYSSRERDVAGLWR